MQEQLTDILDNILGLLLLEGTYDIQEDEEGYHVTIDIQDPGRLIGYRGESLDSLQLLISQLLSRKGTADNQSFKRVIIDVSGWRKQKEEDLEKRAQDWARQVIESGKELELEPMSPWQRRVIHTAVGEIEGVESESVGEGRERHLVIKIKSLK